MNTKFKESFPFDQRRNESNKILDKYPNSIPCIIERHPDMCKKNQHNNIKKKYLVPKDLNLGQFIYIIRQKIKIYPEQSMFLFINSQILPVSTVMSQIYTEHKDEDGFLYILCKNENTFGSYQF